MPKGLASGRVMENSLNGIVKLIKSTECQITLRYFCFWTVFALCSPVTAYFAWLTKKQGIFPKIVSVGIIAVSILSSIALFDRPRIYDLLIDGILVYFLFFKKINR